MPRPLRIEFDGAWYHVMNRGARRWKIFHDEHDFHFFLSLLWEIRDIWNIEVHAYSLMSNHFHLLLHTPNSGLSKGMKYLSGTYAQYYNKKYKKDGPLFRGRFKSIVVEKDAYLLALVRYIHLNPVKAGMCARPEEHRWTSHCAYLDKKKRPRWLVLTDVLSELGKTDVTATRRLDDFVKSKEDTDLVKVLNATRKINILGTEGFKDWIKYNFIDRACRDVALPTMRANHRVKLSPEKILHYVLSEYHLESRSDLFRKKRSNEAKAMLMHLLRQVLGLSHADIAKFIQMRTPTVSKALQRFHNDIDNNGLVRAKAYRNNLLSYVQV